MNASSSSEYLSHKLHEYVRSNTKPAQNKLKQYVRKTLVEDGLGIMDASDDEIDRIATHPFSSSSLFADMISRRAQIGWSTHGHSAVDVNIYGSAGTNPLRGNHENTDIGEFLKGYLDVDVESITRELNQQLALFGVASEGTAGWMGRIPSEEELKLASSHYEQLKHVADEM